MDTISQESNSSFSFLPALALVVGVVAVVLGGIALAKVSATSKQLEAQAALSSRIDSLEPQVRSAVTTAENASQRISKVISDTNSAFKQFGDVITTMQDDLKKAQEAPRPAPAAATSGAKAGSTPPVAGPGEYVVKSGDTGTKIASSLGVTVQALEAVNPGVDWRRLHVGQKLKVPQK
jgi:LysM repeat protein